MTPPVIGLAGYMRSGKSTAADRLIHEHGFVSVNFADALRDAMAALDPYVDGMGRGTRYSDALALYGYDEAKSAYPEVRRLLQVLGTEVGRNILGPTVWVEAWGRRVERIPFGSIVVADVRFPNEVKAVRDAGGEMWWIARPGCEPSGHASERSVGPGDCDTVIANSGTLDELHRKVDAWLV